MNKIEDILTDVANCLSKSNKSKAIKIINSEYPFLPSNKKRKNKRKYTRLQSLDIFIRDGFIDRYTGEKLIYPSVLYAIAYELPEAFPMGGSKENSHSAHWDLFPTIDHIDPIANGGEDIPENWITTSMTTNMKKSSMTVEQLNLKIHPPGKLDDWDGLCSWYVQYFQNHEYLSSIDLNKSWHKAIIKKF